MIQLRHSPNRGPTHEEVTPIQVTYLTGSQIKEAARIAERRGYSRQLDRTFVRDMQANTRFPVVMHMYSGSDASPVIRCTLIADANGNEVTLDVDVGLFLDAAHIEVPDAIVRPTRPQAPSLN